ncbi:unnamed protein product [Calypogeia fissa]
MLSPAQVWLVVEHCFKPAKNGYEYTYKRQSILPRFLKAEQVQFTLPLQKLSRPIIIAALDSHHKE